MKTSLHFDAFKHIKALNPKIVDILISIVIMVFCILGIIIGLTDFMPSPLFKLIVMYLILLCIAGLAYSIRE